MSPAGTTEQEARVSGAATQCPVAEVQVLTLEDRQDDRGTFTELFRAEWGSGPAPLQWNAVRSRPAVLRGVHVHPAHHDYLTALHGTLLLGLHDLRPESPTCGTSTFLTLSGHRPTAVAIPPGVCHGFYFPEPTTHVYGVSEYWNLDDELGCRFDAPELRLDWPDTNPVLSQRDRDAGDYRTMLEAYLALRAPAGR